MNLFLIAVALAGVVAVLVGNVIIRLNRRRLDPVLAFTTVPELPAVAAPGGARLPRFEPSAEETRRLPRVRIGRPPVAVVLFLVSFAVYVVIGGILALHYGSVIGDAESRVADGWYVWFSRDPHLAAVGFVWAPLPSLFVAPLLAFKSVWPALTQRAFAGNIVSAAFVAGCVVQLRATLRELGTNRIVCWVLVIAFALNPMILYYGANGMAEGIQLFFLILGVRYLLRWLESRELRSLVYSSVALAVGYLTRYEAIAAAGVGTAVVAFVALRAAGPVSKASVRRASMDVIVYALPPAAAFIGWAVVSYVITGSAFQYTTSQYGNSAQLNIVGGGFTAQHLGYPLPVFGALQLLAFAPLLPVLLAGACYLGWKRGDERVLALFPLLGVLGFTYFLFVSGSAFPWLRFYLPGVPLSVLCIALVLNPAPGARAAPLRRPIVQSLGLALVAAILVAPALPTTALAMNDPRLGAGEREYLAWVLWGRPDNSSQRGQQALLSSVRSLTDSIDARHLRSGSIIVDTFTQCVSLMVMTSRNPHQFVITSDRDFQPILADPPTFKTQYLLVPPNGGYGGLDALNRSYPDLYVNGARFAVKVWQAHTPGCPPFRLYRVVSSPRLGA